MKAENIGTPKMNKVSCFIFEAKRRQSVSNNTNKTERNTPIIQGSRIHDSEDLPPVQEIV